jgi:hypothetical protein
MMMTRSGNGRGSLIIDKILSRPGRRAIGRVQRASGTNSPKIFRAINAMIDILYEQEDYTPIEAIRDRRMKAIDVHRLYCNKRLGEIRDDRSAGELKETWNTWAEASPRRWTMKQRKYAWSKLVSVLPVVPALGDLPDAVMALRDTLAAHRPAFNRTRAATLAFLRDRVTKRHALYEQVSAIASYPEKTKQRPAPTIARALTVRAALSAEAAELWWSMYSTGMGPDEIDGQWIANGQTVEVLGGKSDGGLKRGGRRRKLPQLATPARRNIGWTQFREALGELGLEPYDARRGFLHWLEEAGVTRIRRKMYAGHAVGDVTGGYERAELEAFYATDRNLALAKLAIEEQKLEAKKEGLKLA